MRALVREFDLKRNAGYLILLVLQLREEAHIIFIAFRSMHCHCCCSLPDVLEEVDEPPQLLEYDSLPADLPFDQDDRRVHGELGEQICCAECLIYLEIVT